MRWFVRLGLVLLPVAAWAQTPVVNPSKVLFDSPDHTVACPADACLVSYTVEVWGIGVDPATGAPVSTSTLPKSAVQPTGATPAYQAQLADCVPPVSAPPGQTVVLRMVAVGPYLSSARSNGSNPFVRSVAPRPLAALRVE